MIKVLFAIFLLQSNCEAAYWARTINSKSADYQKFLEEHQGLSFVEWVQSQAKIATPNPPSLDKALELTGKDSAQALVFFGKALQEIKAELMGPQSREMTLAIDNRVRDLDIPERSKHSFLVELNDLGAAPETTLGKTSTQDEMFHRELKLTLERIRKIPGLDDAVVFVDGSAGLSARIRDPNASFHQWAVLSNVFEPLMIVGNWRDFQAQLQFSDLHSSAFVPLSEGSCPHLNWRSNSSLSQSAVGIFESNRCGQDAEIGVSQNIFPSTHLSQTSGTRGAFEGANQNWKWMVPVGIVVAGGIAYALKDKHISITLPTF